MKKKDFKDLLISIDQAKKMNKKFSKYLTSPCKRRSRVIDMVKEELKSICKMKIMCKDCKIKIFHDISCNCYDCRKGLSLKAKD